MNTRDVILQLKKVREEKQLSYGDILEMMEKNGDYLAKSTISRVFKEGSEENDSFRYEDTIRPLARVLLDIDNLEESDDIDTKALKSLIQYKSQRIDELEAQLAQIEIKHHEKMERERAMWNQRIDFLNKQIERKDSRIDKLLEAVFVKDSKYDKLLQQYLSCPYSHLGKDK